ncbi:MAG: FKBP-type peptidyl-prolyl cis-trans isomerase [Cyclobacteriaceae bacterium]
MKRYNLFLFLFLMVLIWGCNTDQTREGLTFKKVRKGNEGIVKPGQYLLMDVVAIDENDSLWFDTRKNDQPAIVRVDPYNEKIKEKGEVGVYRMLGKGDSVTFTVNVSTIYHDTWLKPVPKGLNPDMEVDYIISVKDVFDDQGLENFQKIQAEKLEQLRLNHQIDQFGKDTVLIDDYLKKKSIQALKTESGIRYVIQQEGKGKKIERGTIVLVRYTGYLLDGKTFDSNLDKKDPFQVVVGSGAVISGWDEILKLMTLGSKYTVYLPSLFGYGDRNLPGIPADSVLIFEIEVVKIL